MELEEIIKKRIITEGPISFEDFMEMALYYPNLGYYTNKHIKIGREGDFFTSSHLGEAFGILLSRAIENFYRDFKGKDNFTVTEIGPGMGYLAYDILCNLKIPIEYNLVETNPFLIDIQKQRLTQHIEKIRWYPSIDDLPYLRGVIICNEIFDALPVRIFEMRENLLEVYVTIKDENLCEILLPSRIETQCYIEEFAPWVLSFRNYRSEVCLSGRSFLKKLSDRLKEGFLFIFDYGYTSEEYYAPYRNRGTLLCYHRHRTNENPFLNIGKQDITAHVNFTAIERWAEEFGFNREKFSSQGSYLISLCNERVLRMFEEKNLIQKFKRLVLPQGMGETHRVMILSKIIQ